MAIVFRCPSCSHKLGVKDENAGKTAKCPNCGRPIEVPPAGPDSSHDLAGGNRVSRGQQPGQRAEVLVETEGIQQVAGPAGSLGSTITTMVLVLMAVAFFVVGVGETDSWHDANRSYLYQQTRFRTDNAIGATANALERIVRDYPPRSAAPWFVCCLLCWAILAIERLRRSLNSR